MVADNLICLRPLWRFATAAAVLLFAAPLSEADSLTLDENFRAPTFAQPQTALRVLPLSDGKFLLYSGPNTVTERRGGAIARYFVDGTLDPTFNFSRDYQIVTGALATGDGKLVVAASQRTYGDTTFTERILRLNADGTIDPSFPALVVVSNSEFATVQQMISQPDGKILVAGYFPTFAGTPRPGIVRLLPDGSLDSSFNPPQFAGGYLRAKPVVLGDGKVLVGGDFTSVNGISHRGVVRLNADGSLDGGFRALGFTLPYSTGIRGLVVQSDGRVVLAGNFGSSTGSIAPLFRLNSNGTADTTFTLVTNLPRLSRPPTAQDLVAQADGKLIAPVGSQIVRFNSGGSLDSSFHQPYLFDYTTQISQPGMGSDAELQQDGRVLVAGNFTAADPVVASERINFGLVRLQANGDVDSSLSLNRLPALELAPNSFVRLADGSTYAAFGVNNPAVEPLSSYNLARFLPDGTLAAGPSLIPSDQASLLTQRFETRNVVPLADGELLVFGLRDYDAFNRIYSAVRIFPDGREDPGFDRTNNLGANKPIALADGKVLLSVGGIDLQSSVSTRQLLSRTTPSGQYDASFKLDPSIANDVATRSPFNFALLSLYSGSRVLAVQPDGKILFLYLGSDRLFHLRRLRPNGSIDPSFQATTLPPFDLTQSFVAVYDYLAGGNVVPFNGSWTATPPLYDAVVRPDGKIIIAGRFTSFAGVSARGLVRLGADGTVDSSFDIGAGAQWVSTTEAGSFVPSVEQIEATVDGKFLIAGTFEAFSNHFAPGLARLDSNWSVDPSFGPLAVRQKFRLGSAQLERQADGSFFLSGPYSFPSETEPSFIHLNQTGGVPVVGSALLATAVVGRAFRYQIIASGQPTRFDASNLPAGFNLDQATGVISGTATAANVGTFQVTLTASNGDGTSAPRSLILSVPAGPQVVAAVSRRTHGSAGDFDISLPLSGRPGVECRAPDASNQWLVVITLNNEMIAGETTVTGAGSPRGYFNRSGNSFYFYVTATDSTTVTITTHNVTDRYLQSMPDTSMQVSFLLADVNGDGSVNSGDTIVARNSSGRLPDLNNLRADVNADGIINSGDIIIVRSRSGQSLPAPPARVAAPVILD